MSFSNPLEESIGTHLLRSGSWLKPTSLYLALLTADPGETGQLTEVAGGSYTRVQAGPEDADWNLPNAGNGQFTNAVEFVFTAPTADWGRVTHFALLDAASGGLMLAYAPLSVPRDIYGNDPAPLFAAGDLKLTFTGGFSAWLAEQIGSHLLRSDSWEKPTGLYLGLQRSDGNEVTGSNYSRLAVGPSDAVWSGPQEGNGTFANQSVLVWPSPDSDWGSVSAAVLWDAASGGNALLTLPLPASKSLLAGALAPNFPSCGLSLTFD